MISLFSNLNNFHLPGNKFSRFFKILRRCSAFRAKSISNSVKTEWNPQLLVQFYFVATNEEFRVQILIYKIVCHEGNLMHKFPSKKPARGARRSGLRYRDAMELEDRCSIIDSIVIVTWILLMLYERFACSRIKSDKCDSVVLDIAFVIVEYYCTLDATQRRIRIRDCENNISRGRCRMYSTSWQSFKISFHMHHIVFNLNIN